MCVEFLKTKVPLWCLLPMFIIIICGGIQIGADARLHSEQRATFIQNARVNASNAESALNFLCSERIEEEPPEEVHAALTQAILCSEYLSDAFWSVPVHTIFGKQRRLSDGSPITYFAYAKSELEEVRKSYDLEEKFSAEDDSVLRRYRDAYADLAEGLSDGRELSDEQFAACVSGFAQAIYPHSED